MAKSNQSDANFDRLFGLPDNSAGRGVAGLMMLDPALIETRTQPRTQFDDGPLQELAESIRERRAKNEGIEGSGLLQPLLVTNGAGGNSYRLIAGERRLRAARHLQLPLIPAVVVADNPRETLANQLVENLQRAGLNPLEEGRAFAAWMAETDLSVREAAQAVGKDKNYISNRVRLLKMGEDVQQMVSRRANALVHAQLIEPVKDPQQRAQLIEAVTRNEISVAELKQRLQPALQNEKVEVSLRRDNAKIEAKVPDSRSGSKPETLGLPLSNSAAIDQMKQLIETWPPPETLDESEKRSLLQNLDALSQKLSELRICLEI